LDEVQLSNSVKLSLSLQLFTTYRATQKGEEKNMIDFDLPVTMVGPCGGINFSLYIAQYFMFTVG
jgi:hypothetical protein